MSWLRTPAANQYPNSHSDGNGLAYANSDSDACADKYAGGG